MRKHATGGDEWNSTSSDSDHALDSMYMDALLESEVNDPLSQGFLRCLGEGGWFVRPVCLCALCVCMSSTGDVGTHL